MEYALDDIRNIAFERINESFSRGAYHGIEVIIDMKTGYINGTALVAQTNGKKQSNMYR